METKNILTAEFLDILFDGKNKSYGAYELRKNYDRRIGYAITGTFVLCLLFVGSSLLANARKKSTAMELATTVELQNFKKEEIKQELPKPEEKKPLPKLETINDTPPLIVEDDKVKPEDELKPVEDMLNTHLDNFRQEGDKGEDMIAPPVEKATGVAEAPVKKNDIDEIFIDVQQQAVFPGGQAAWNKFLQRNLNQDIPVENGAPPARYTVTVSFIVDKNGFVSDVRAENDPGYGIAAEAVRVIQKGPKWNPAVQNGRNVMYRQKQNITFQVMEQ